MKNLKLITLTSLLAIGILANCHKREIGGNQANGAILAQLVGGLGKGNCALNINLTTLYSGAIIQAAVATSTIFTQTDYEAAIGATISSQGYSSYASVPYNRKYDAFIKGGGTYDATARTADINTAKTALDATTTGQGLAALSGTSLMACTRIPKANCSLSGISTADRATAFKNGAAAYDLLQNNADCRKVNTDLMAYVNRIQFIGTPKGTQITGFTTRSTITADPSDVFIGISEGSTTTAVGNSIFAEKAYPASSALVNMSSLFATAFPLASGTTAQANSTIPYYGASNFGAVVVDSCESVGMPGYGPTAVAPTTAAEQAAKKDLTSAKEIAYAFSNENAAAVLYAGVTALYAASSVSYTSSTQSTNDAIACNNSFRSKFAVPQIIGGGTLAKINNATSGDGSATSLTTLCVYGKTSAARTIAKASLSTLGAIPDCTLPAKAAASTFGDAGLMDFAGTSATNTFPNGN